MQLYVNGRFRCHRVTGVQRYAQEITSRLGAFLQICEPMARLRGIHGHFWEQTTLPRKASGHVLWSPCAAGPLHFPNHVVTFHDLFPLNDRGWYSKRYSFAYRILMRRLAKSATHLIAVSEYTRKQLVDSFQLDESKITVVHNGVGPGFKPAPPSAIEETRQFLNLPSSRYLLSLSSLEPRKNLHQLLKAWSEIQGSLPADLWLVLSGASDQPIYGNTDFDRLPPRVFLTGYVPEAHLVPLYSGSTAFIFPSLAEGFGLPPLEAMACGAPVLTSSTTSLPEVCGSAALYLNPEDPSDIARTLKLIASDAQLRRRLVERGRTQAAPFDWDRAATRTLSILDDCSRGNLKSRPLVASGPSLRVDRIA